jgi:diacylglycerol kinase
MENKNFLNSIRIAFWGIKSALKKERNFRIQFLIAIIVIILMVVLELNTIEKSILLLTIFVVLSLELINSQIEKILDLIQPEIRQKIKTIKDLSAGAVLFSVFGSIVIGILIFLPHIITIIEGR